MQSEDLWLVRLELKLHEGEVIDLWWQSLFPSMRVHRDKQVITSPPPLRPCVF